MNNYLKTDVDRLINSLNDLNHNKNNRNVKELMENVNKAFYYLTKYDLKELTQEELDILNKACYSLRLAKRGAWAVLRASLSIDIMGLLVTLSIANGKDFLTIGAFLYFGYQFYIDTIGNSMYSVPARGLKDLALAAGEIMDKIENVKEYKLEIQERKEKEPEENIEKEINKTLDKENEFVFFEIFLDNINTLSDEDKVSSFRFLMEEVNNYIRVNPSLKYFFRGKVAECYYATLNSLNWKTLISFVDPFFVDYLEQYGYTMLDGFGETLMVIKFRNYLYKNRNKFTSLDNLKYISAFITRNKEKSLVLKKKAF